MKLKANIIEEMQNAEKERVAAKRANDKEAELFNMGLRVALEWVLESRNSDIPLPIMEVVKGDENRGGKH